MVKSVLVWEPQKSFRSVIKIADPQLYICRRICAWLNSVTLCKEWQSDKDNDARQQKSSLCIAAAGCSKTNNKSGYWMQWI